MDSYNWLLLELMTQQASRALLLTSQRSDRRPVPPTADGSGVKRSLASALVRLGLRLDPAAGEGLGASDLALARAEGGQL